jgi:hypothetical protein
MRCNAVEFGRIRAGTPERARFNADLGNGKFGVTHDLVVTWMLRIDA